MRESGELVQGRVSPVSSLERARVWWNRSPMEQMDDPSQSGARAIAEAERTGLQLAILCRTIAVGVAFAWVFGVAIIANYGPDNYSPAPSAVAAVAAFFLFGLLALFLIRTQRDRWWLKYTSTRFK